MSNISEFQLQEMLARTEQGRMRGQARARGGTSHVQPNGSGVDESPADAAEPGTENSVLRPQIVAECKRRAWFVAYGKTCTRTGRVLGEADLIVFADRGRVFCIELKSRTGKPSTAQLGVGAQLKKLGHAWAVVRSLSAFVALVDVPRDESP